MKKEDDSAQDLPADAPINKDPFDMGWCDGQHDDLPKCPYAKGTPENAIWWEGFFKGLNYS